MANLQSKHSCVINKLPPLSEPNIKLLVSTYPVLQKHVNIKFRYFTLPKSSPRSVLIIIVIHQANSFLCFIYRTFFRYRTYQVPYYMNAVQFGRQVAVCVNKRPKNAIIRCRRFQKFNFDCILLKLLNFSPKTENIFKLVCPVWTQSSIMILGTQIYSTHSHLTPPWNTESKLTKSKFNNSDFKTSNSQVHKTKS